VPSVHSPGATGGNSTAGCLSWGCHCTVLGYRVLTLVKRMKCLKQVLRCASSFRLTIRWKWEWSDVGVHSEQALENGPYTTRSKWFGKGWPVLPPKKKKKKQEGPKRDAPNEASTSISSLLFISPNGLRMSHSAEI